MFRPFKKKEQIYLFSHLNRLPKYGYQFFWPYYRPNKLFGLLTFRPLVFWLISEIRPTVIQLILEVLFDKAFQEPRRKTLSQEVTPIMGDSYTNVFSTFTSIFLLFSMVFSLFRYWINCHWQFVSSLFSRRTCGGTLEPLKN